MSERWVDVSHEALIRGWPRLRAWIEEDRAGLRTHRRLTEAAEEWDKTRDAGALYRGVKLAQAVEWRERSHPRLNPLERAFLDASVALEQHETHMRDRRRRRTIAWLTVSLAVFATLATLAGLQWRQAVRQGQIALARQLSSQAVLMRGQTGTELRRLALAADAMKRLDGVNATSFDVDLALRGELANVPRHQARTTVAYWHADVQLSTDGANLIVGHFASLNAKVVEAATGAERITFEGGPAGAFTASRADKTVSFQMGGNAARNHIVAWSADARYVVTEAYDGDECVVQVWDTETGTEVMSLDLDDDGRYQLSGDGKYLAITTTDQASGSDRAETTRVWDVQVRHAISGSARGTVRGISDDGKVMATTDGVWTVGADLTPVVNWETSSYDVVLAPDGGYAAVAVERNGRQQIEVWSTTDRRSPVVLPIDDAVSTLLALAPGGRFIALRLEANDETQLHDVVRKSMVARTALFVGAAACSSAGTCSVATPHAGDSAVDTWTLAPQGGAALAVANDHDVVAAGITAGGLLTTIARDGERLIVRSGDIRTGREVAERATQVAGTNAVFAPDGNTFAVLRATGLEVRRADAAQPVAVFAYANPVRVVWSSDGRYLAAQQERAVRVWDLGDRRSLGELTLPGPATALALSAGGQSLAAIVASGEMTRSGQLHFAKRWTVSTAEELTSFELGKGRSIRTDTHCAVSPDAKYMVTDDLTVIDMASGDVLVTLGVDANNTTDCVITADARHLATTERETETSPEGVRLWELTTGREAFRLPTRDRPMALDERSGYLATVAEDMTVRVWPLRQADLIEEACRRLPRNLSEAEWREYVGAESYRKTCPQRP